MEFAQMNNIYILGTIHATHHTNPNYGFHHILEKVEQFSPDLICVEIRNRDMVETNSYLREYYPPEMVLIKEEYEGKIAVIGFDWRGAEIENRRIGDKVPETHNIFSLMQQDTTVRDFILQRKALMNPFFNSCTLDSCQSDYETNYDKIKNIEEELDYYLCEQGYKNLVDYDIEREERIHNNIKSIIKHNPSKRIMIITGISHKGKLKEFLNI
jgi:pheromone shutdown protein TraB